MCKPVALALGLDTKNEASLWRDRAIVEIDVAVMHSFREAGMGERARGAQQGGVEGGACCGRQGAEVGAFSVSGSS